MSPHPAIRTDAVAAQRSRNTASAMIGFPWGLLSASRIAKTNAATYPPAQTIADDGLRMRRGTSTAITSSTPAAASSASDGERADQPTGGLGGSTGSSS